MKTTLSNINKVSSSNSTLAPRPKPPIFECISCGFESLKWQGQCQTCGDWNTFVEVTRSKDPEIESFSPLISAGAPKTFAATKLECLTHTLVISSGISEFDRVLGGGFAKGSVTLLAGEPGVGKSTLTLQVLSGVSQNLHSLIISAEESPEQVMRRAERLGVSLANSQIACEANIATIEGYALEQMPDFLVIDSIQTVMDTSQNSLMGSPNQVKACTSRLIKLAKENGITTLLIGHVTKDGNLAGPRVLEHLVDTVLTFEGGRGNSLRTLASSKHRFGPSDELGIFEMTQKGLLGVADPSGMLMEDRCNDSSGSIVIPVMDHKRPLLIELQALSVKTFLPTPKRTVQGIDTSRLLLVLAVLEKRGGYRFFDQDIFASVVGGYRVMEPAIDLALGVALISSLTNSRISNDLVVAGEIGLGGEIRQVQGIEARLKEACRMGFKKAVIPTASKFDPPEIEVIKVSNLDQAIEAVFV
ncbi:MAG: DNA repair protein RadA [Acidimicrobiales bacterium]|nr:DNA repair protein RadA [Acidimicrobiales bacterium]